MADLDGLIPLDAINTFTDILEKHLKLECDKYKKEIRERRLQLLGNREEYQEYMD